MAGISDEKLQELRDRVDLVSVVQRRVPLKKSGHDWKGLCPFHGEKSPSFYVVPDKKLFHCFGCGVSGDAIKFVMQLDSRSFREAVEQLAGEAGVDLTPPDPEEARRSARRAALAEVNEKACVFYERVLWEHPKGKVAREHLEKRGISEATARAWRLGYAPNLWDSLAKSLAQKKVDPLLVEEAGLAVPRKKGQGLYDRFRGRLIIPIRESGRVVAFGGRLLEGESDAKYLNSPDTPLYQKGHTLFGLDQARQAIRQLHTVFIVEGYFDVIGLHQGGTQHAVAACGTAMSDKHLDLVSRAGAQSAFFLFDGDQAGIRAAQRASEVAAAAGIPANVLVPPDGQDPDELIRAIASRGFADFMGAAKPSIEFLLERALAGLPKNAAVELRVRAIESVKGIVDAAPSELARGLYLEKIAERMGAPVDLIRRALAAKPAPAAKPAQPARAAEKPLPAPPQATRLSGKMELQIAAQMLDSPALCAVVERHGADFLVAALRELAERAFEQARQGKLDPSGLIHDLEDDRLRQALIRERTELSQAVSDPEISERQLKLKLERHSKLVAQEQAERKQRASPRVPRS